MSSLKITTIQSNIHWENIAKNLEMFEKKINSIQEKTHIIILPEMFSTGFSNNTSVAETIDGTAFQWMKKISRNKNVVLIGSIMFQENNQFYNRCFCVLPNGNYGQYDKRHLFSLAKENEFYTSGNKRLICSVNGWKIYIQICYDLRFPVWSRQNCKDTFPEYDIFINVANWPAKRIEHWKTLLKARAIENQCFAIGVNRTGTDGNNISYDGNTSVINPLGEIIYQKSEVEDIFTTTFSKEALQNARQFLPFLNDADSFFIS